MPIPLRAFSSDPHRRTGAPPIKSTRLAQLRCASLVGEAKSTTRLHSLAACSLCFGFGFWLWLWPLLLARHARRSGSGPAAPYGAAGGWRKARRVAGMDAGQFFDRTRMSCRKTPEPARVPEGRAIGVTSLLVTSDAKLIPVGLWPRREK